MALQHLICPANSPLDLTRVSDQTISCFYMFQNLPFTLDIMVIRAFSVTGPTLWNALAKEIRLCKSVDSFKSDLKTNFFKKAFA